MKTKLVKSIMAPYGLPCLSHDGCRNGSRADDRAGDGRRKASRDLGHADNSDRLPRSRAEEFSVPGNIHGGTHGDGVERGDTAGSEDAWRRCLAPYPTGNNYAFSFKFFTFNSENVFTGWTVIAGKQPWMRQEKPMRGPQPWRSTPQTAS